MTTCLWALGTLTGEKRYDGTITLEVFGDDETVLLQQLEISRRLVLDLWNR
jgi:hypothetical protein